jgi:arabinose-5-phosphate isomerase
MRGAPISSDVDGKRDQARAAPQARPAGRDGSDPAALETVRRDRRGGRSRPGLDEAPAAHGPGMTAAATPAAQDGMTAAATPAAQEGMTAAATLAAARRVVAAERAGLEALEASLGQAFVDAVERLEAVTGRIVVTGMGKSGHVARKIAASLASTGTPAQFVHPAEAAHGDLGMITPADAIVALSNSGETAELEAILLHARRFAVPLVAITGRAGSTLAEAADVALILPALVEACPMGLAPTTSTTCMLALGDALAVALLERRGFSAADFAVLHPGGKLGARLLRVEQLMHRDAALPLVGTTASMAEAIVAMTGKRLGCVGVVDAEGRLVGIVTDGDLRRHLRPDLLEQPVAAIMSPRPRTIAPRALAVEALALMNRHAITVLFAVEGERPVGALHLHDCLRAGLA